MNYEIVNLESKKLKGLKIRTCNEDMEALGNHWQNFMNNYFSFDDKINNKIIALYTNYENDYKGQYDFHLSYEVENNPHIITYSGKYAKFILKGNPHIIIPEFWKKLWSMDINRSYQFDFEEYLNNLNDFENQEIHIYISIK